MNWTYRIATLLLIAVSPVLAEDEKKSADSDKKADKVTFVDHVLPIFRARCGSCHNANDRRGGLVLDQYGAMMEGGSSGPVIEAGDAEFSYLWMLVNHEDTPKMPPNADKLPDEELAVIRKWIDLGALENSGSVANIKKKASLAKIEVSTERPANVAMPQTYLGQPVHLLESRNAVTALATSPWAPLVAVSGYQQIGLYRADSLESLGALPFPEGQPQILKFSRNGALLMAGGGRGGQVGKVVVYDVATGERKVEVGNEYDEVLAADISPDQSLIALGGPKRMVRVYSTATGELVYENKKHTDWVTAIEFSPDGVLLATGDRSNGLVIWEADSGKLFYDLQGHKGAVTDVSWRPDSNVVASASEDGTLKLWEMINGNQIKSVNAHGGGVSAVDYTREGNLVTIGRDKVARLWDGNGGKLKDFGGLADIGMEVAYDAETKRVFGGEWNGIVHVWNSEDAQKVGEIDTNPPSVSTLLASLEPQLETVRTDYAAQAKIVADLSKALADRKQVADKAVAELNAATKTAEAATQQKTAAMKDATDKKQTLDTANQQVATTKAIAEQSAAAASQAEKLANAAKVKLDQVTETVNQVRAAVANLAEGVAKFEATYNALLAAAQPTQDEQAAQEKDPAVKAAIAKRAEVAKTAEANLTFLKLLTAQTQSESAEVEKVYAAIDAEYQAANSQFVVAAENAKQADATYKSAVADQQAAQTALNAANETLAKLVELEKTALADKAEKQAIADKLLAEAKPTDEEQKTLQAAQAALSNLETELKSLEERVKRMKEIQTQVASAATAGN